MKYQVKIDEQESSQSYSFDELIDLGFLDDYDDKIFVRAVGESQWRIARDYPYSQHESISVDHATESNSGSAPRYRIDQYGQIVRTTATSSSINSDTLSVSSNSISFNSDGGVRTIQITSSKPWRISINPASWITVSSSATQLSLTIDRNYGSARSDYMKIKAGNKEQTINISQSAYPTISSSSSSVSTSDEKGCGTLLGILVVWGIGIAICMATKGILVPVVAYFGYKITKNMLE